MNTSLRFRIVATARRRASDDPGVTTVVVALVLTALLFAAALAIDGGQGYYTGRQMQNAADAAAISGLRQLVLFKQGTITDATIITSSSLSTASANKATTGTCEVVNKTLTVLGTCDAQASNAAAVGIKYTASTNSVNNFGPAAGSAAQFGVSRTSTIIVTPPTLKTPFAVCSGTQLNTLNGGTNYNPGTAADAQLPALLLTRYIPTPNQNPPAANTVWTTSTIAANSATSSWYPLVPELNPPAGNDLNTLMTNFPMWVAGETTPRFKANPAAIGKTYWVHGPAGNSSNFAGCGRGSSNWKGLIDPTVPISLPGETAPDNGTKAGPVTQELTSGGACQTGQLYVGCKLIVPLCPGSNGDNGGGNGIGGFDLYCTNWGTFSLMGWTANEHWLKFVGPSNFIATGSGSGGGSGTIDWSGSLVFDQVA